MTTFRIEERVSGEWRLLRDGVVATLVALVSAISGRSNGAPWRLVSEAGEIVYTHGEGRNDRNER